MKFWFFIAILANLVLFLWEVQNGALQKLSAPSVELNQGEKQILLVSELTEEQLNQTFVDESERMNKEITVKDELQKEEVVMVAEIIADQLIEIKEINQSQDTVLKTNEDALEGLDNTEIEEKKTNVEGKENIEVDSDLLLIDERDIAETDEIVAVSKIANELTSEISINESEVVAEEKETVLNCYEIGPFANKKSLSSWLSDNEIATDNSKHIYKEHPFLSAYLVYYPAAETYAESKKNEKMLKRKGISDLWLFRKGAMRGVISLGLFKKKQRAERLVYRLAKKGIQVEWMERFNNKTSLFARVTLQEEPAKLPKPLTSAVCDE